MTKHKDKAKAPKKAKRKGNKPKAPPPDLGGMGIAFDAAMDRIANAPWPPKR